MIGCVNSEVIDIITQGEQRKFGRLFTGRVEIRLSSQIAEMRREYVLTPWNTIGEMKKNGNAEYTMKKNSNTFLTDLTNLLE